MQGWHERSQWAWDRMKIFCDRRPVNGAITVYSTRGMPAFKKNIKEVQEALLPVYCDALHYLLNSGVNPEGDVEEENAQRPILAATQILEPKFVAFLIAHGADPCKIVNFENAFSLLNIIKFKNNGKDPKKNQAIDDVEPLLHSVSLKKFAELCKEKKCMLSWLPRDLRSTIKKLSLYHVC